MRQYKHMCLALACFSLAIMTTCKTRTDLPENFKVVVVSQVEIEPIKQLRAGFEDEFRNSQFAKDRKALITEYNAQGDQSLMNQLADRIATEKPDLVYVLGTSAAQVIQKRVPDVLLIQGAVTDPVSAGLANSWEASGKKYIATTDLPPIAKQVDLIKGLTPRVSRLGVLYNPGEINSVSVISRLRQQTQNSTPRLTLVERPIANSSEVATALQSLLTNVDALYLPPDNTVHAAIQVVARFAKENKIPWYATVSNALDEGAVATLSLDFYQLGKESALLALMVLTEGKDPANIPIKVNENPTVAINGKVAAEYGIDVSNFRSQPGIRIVD